MDKNLILYHGTFHDASMWNHWKQSEHAKDTTILTPTLYIKDKPIGEHSLGDYINQAQEHLNSIDDQVHIVGWSMGATVARHIAGANPSKVVSAQFIAPTGPYGSIRAMLSSMGAIKKSPSWAFNAAIKGGLTKTSKGYIPPFDVLKTVLFNKLSPEEATIRYNSLLDSSLRAGFEEYMWFLDSKQINRSKPVTCWSRTYAGSEDRLTPPIMAQEIRKQTRGSLLEFEGKGHCLPFEEGNLDLLEEIITYANHTEGVLKRNINM